MKKKICFENFSFPRSRTLYYYSCYTVLHHSCEWRLLYICLTQIRIAVRLFTISTRNFGLIKSAQLPPVIFQSCGEERVLEVCANGYLILDGNALFLW